MGTVHFVDTSVFVVLLNVPGKNEHHEEAKREYERLNKNNDVFVLPLAVLVETGNHIAHIANGDIRYEIANKFVSIVQKAVKANTNWNVVPEIPADVMERIFGQFPIQAKAETGFGDVSIIEQFEKYWRECQPIGEMRIWSFDAHLSGYLKTGGLSRRKDR